MVDRVAKVYNVYKNHKHMRVNNVSNVDNTGKLLVIKSARLGVFSLPARRRSPHGSKHD